MAFVDGLIEARSRPAAQLLGSQRRNINEEEPVRDERCGLEWFGGL
jgi:hypothetical protein